MEIDLKRSKGSTVSLKASPGEVGHVPDKPKTILRKVSHLRLHNPQQLIYGKGAIKSTFHAEQDGLEMKEGPHGVEVKIDDETSAVVTYNNVPLYHVKG